MSGLRLIAALGAVLTFALASSRAAAENPDEIRILVPAFEGPDELGRNVATVLNLQLWQTLRKAPASDWSQLIFGDSTIVWSPEPLPALSHLEARKAASQSQVLAQLVLWGRAWHYGSGVAVETNVTLPLIRDYRQKNFAVWQIEDSGQSIEADVPRRRFSMASIVLTRDVTERYSLPSALHLYDAPEGGSSIGEIGNLYMCLECGPGRAKVCSGNTIGWVHLPRLSATKTEVVDMLAAIVRVFRSDWEGAEEYFTRVIKKPATRTPLRIDAHLYRGMTKERRGLSGRKDFERAYALSPYSIATIKYMVMSDLAALARGEDAMDLTRRIDERLKQDDYVFADDDPWPDAAHAMSRALAER